MAPIDFKDIQQRLSGLKWQLEDEKLTRQFDFKNFVEAVDFVNQLAELAEQMQHHPDILIHSWNRVKLELYTHSEGGLTELDFSFAAAVDSSFS